MIENIRSPIEKFVESFIYNGITFEVVERPDVIWVGCLDYADNHENDSDSSITLDRYQKYLNIAKHDLIAPDWSASIWVNYGSADKTSGQMFAQETYSANQDERYELMTQPHGLWLRVFRSIETSLTLFGRESIDAWDYFTSGIMQKAAADNGYRENPNVHMFMGYDCHAEYSMPLHACYAYMPVIKDAE